MTGEPVTVQQLIAILESSLEEAAMWLAESEPISFSAGHWGARVALLTSVLARLKEIDASETKGSQKWSQRNATNQPR